MRCLTLSCRRPAPRRPLPVLVTLAAVWLAGCATAPPVTVQGFRSPPAGWSERGGSGAPPAVEDGHLEIGGNRAFIDRVAFHELAGAVDVALVSSEPRGFAGFYLEDRLDRSRGCHAVAVQTGGEVRVYRSREPLEPLGGSGWRDPVREAPTGFHRLGLRVEGDEVLLSVDGKEVGRTSLESASGGPREQGRFRLGIFVRGATARFKSFAGVTPGDTARRLEDLVDWGDGPLAQAHLRAARLQARAFASQPSAGGLYRLLASLEEAARAARAGGDEAGLRSIRTAVERFAADTRAPAGGIGAGDVQAAGFARLGSLIGGVRPDKAEPARGASDPRLASLRDLPPLRLAFEVRGAGPDAIVGKGDFWETVREFYGGLERAAAGELAIKVDVLRSGDEQETTKSVRKVAADQGSVKLAAMEAELKALERRFAEDRLDAEARANVLRGAGKTLGAEVLAQLRTFTFDGASHELQVDDGAAMVKAAKHIATLRADLDRRRQKQETQLQSIPATLHTSSILVELAYSVDLDGKQVASAPRERTYLGIEQWTHPAYRDLGIAASRHDRGEVDRAIAAVRERALRRFRTTVEPRGILSRLPRQEHLPFLVRLARATGSEEDLMSLQWALRTELGLAGQELERTARELVRGGPSGR